MLMKDRKGGVGQSAGVAGRATVAVNDREHPSERLVCPWVLTDHTHSRFCPFLWGFPAFPFNPAKCK